jgi:hypothetical protein
MATESEGWDRIGADLDAMPIHEQTALLKNSLEEAKAKLFLAKMLAERIAAAGDYLRDNEADEFTAAVLEDVKDLQSLLVLQWIGPRTEREVLEQLHLIYFPGKRLDGSLTSSLLDDMLHIRMGLPIEVLMQKARKPEQEYWRRLERYLTENPDEPPGWRQKLGKRQTSAGN